MKPYIKTYCLVFVIQSSVIAGVLAIIYKYYLLLQLAEQQVLSSVLSLIFVLLVVVFGSLTGEALAIHQLLDFDLSFWFGHQGYEYVDLGFFPKCEEPLMLQVDRQGDAAH